jgi:hypothetical protein
MIAQDTGSAIVGPARADIYFGAGDEAGQAAGRVRQTGRFAMLLPRELDPVAAGASVPLPLSRPTIMIGPHQLRPLTIDPHLRSAEVKSRNALHRLAQ